MPMPLVVDALLTQEETAMATDGFVGKNAYIKFGNTELQTYFRTLNKAEEIDLVEQTSGSDADKSWLATVRSGTYDGEFIMPSGTAGTAVFGAVALGTSATLEVGPEGTASGKPKHSVTAIVRSRGEPLTYNDVTTFSVGWQFNGAMSNTAY